MEARVATLLASLLALACAPPAPGGPCDPVDAVLADSAFVVVASPRAGARVSSPFEVRGCSRTFESTVVWELRARDGDVLASGHASGGGVDGAGAFSWRVSFEVQEAELGHLEVYEPDVSGGEGFPPPRSVVPLVLATEAP